MPHERMVAERRRRAIQLCTALPEVEVMTNTGQHRGFRVRGKAFAYYQVDHHRDGRITLALRMALESQAVFVAAKPGRALVRPYAGRHGWVDFDLQKCAADWSELAALVRESYRLVAPASLGKLVAFP